MIPFSGWDIYIRWPRTRDSFIQSKQNKLNVILKISLGSSKQVSSEHMIESLSAHMYNTYMLFPASSSVTFSCHSSFLPRFQSQNIIAIVVIFRTWTGRSVLLVTWRCASTEAFSILAVDNVTICVKNCFSGKFNLNFVDNVYDWRHLLLVSVVYLFCGNLFFIISSFFSFYHRERERERDAPAFLFLFFCRWFCFWLWTTYVENSFNNELHE